MIGGISVFKNVLLLSILVTLLQSETAKTLLFSRDVLSILFVWKSQTKAVFNLDGHVLESTRGTSFIHTETCHNRWFSYYFLDGKTSE